MIIGINLKSVEAKKFSEAKGNIRIDNNTNISSVSEISIPIVKEKVTKIDFKFITKYSQDKKNIGEISMDGDIIYQGRNADIKKSWKNKKALPEDIGIDVMNGVLRKCLIKAVDLSEQVGLPPPLALPVVKPKAKDVGYIG